MNYKIKAIFTTENEVTTKAKNIIAKIGAISTKIKQQFSRNYGK